VDTRSRTSSTALQSRKCAEEPQSWNTIVPLLLPNRVIAMESLRVTPPVGDRWAPRGCFGRERCAPRRLGAGSQSRRGSREARRRGDLKLVVVGEVRTASRLCAVHLLLSGSRLGSGLTSALTVERQTKASQVNMIAMIFVNHAHAHTHTLPPPCLSTPTTYHAAKPPQPSDEQYPHWPIPSSLASPECMSPSTSLATMQNAAPGQASNGKYVGQGGRGAPSWWC
jgi:hypothetical protein